MRPEFIVKFDFYSMLIFKLCFFSVLPMKYYRSLRSFLGSFGTQSNIPYVSLCKNTCF